MAKIARALVSVSDKAGIEAFARALVERGVELVSTGGTAKLLWAKSVPVREVSQLTGFPEIMDGRVKTLHPAVHGGILAVRDNAEHRKQLEEHAIGTIDLVVVNLYPFGRTVADPAVRVDDAIENIDIGGPSMLRSSAKNFGDVTVVVDPDDYARVLADMDGHDGATTLETRLDLARKAFDHTARYDAAIADFLTNRVGLDDGALEVAVTDAMPERIGLTLVRRAGLRYGENPHQRAALYAEPGASGGVAAAGQVQGKELSYNNYLDLDAAWALVSEFDDESVCAIVKHTNPCGAATGATPKEAYERALATDPTSAFGSIIAFNRTVDEETAIALADLFVEAVAAPDFTERALETFSKKKNLRIMRVGDPSASQGFELRRISGGMLAQERDAGRATPDMLRVVTSRVPSDRELHSLLFAWTMVKHVKSNAIVYARDGQLLGVGAGQMSRVDSARIGAEKANHSLDGAVLASDAFFPFRDGLDEAAARGVRAVIQPGGSVRDPEVIAAADEHKIAMIFTGMRHFKH